MSPQQIVKELKSWFEPCPGAIVAFSGGVDSSLVAYAARIALGRERSLAVISASPSLKLSELDKAKQFARDYDLNLRVIVTEELKNPDYYSNPANRCYFCKKTLYTELKEISAEHPDWWVMNGQNADDAGDYRPGIQAANEFDVRRPLAEQGLTKEQVRQAAAHFKLSVWDKPASPCLSSRIPYGEQVTEKKLRQIEDAEAVLIERGFPIVRVRHFGHTAKVEVPPERIEELRTMFDEIERAFRQIGFERADFDREGFVSGKLNRAIGVG